MSLIEMGLEGLEMALVSSLPGWWWWSENVESRIITKKLEPSLVNTFFSTPDLLFPPAISEQRIFLWFKQIITITNAI